MAGLIALSGGAVGYAAVTRHTASTAAAATEIQIQGNGPDAVAVDSTHHRAFVGTSVPQYLKSKSDSAAQCAPKGSCCPAGEYWLYDINTSTLSKASSPPGCIKLDGPALAVAVDPPLGEVVVDEQTKAGGPSSPGASELAFYSETKTGALLGTPTQTIQVPSQLSHLALDPVSGYLFATTPYAQVLDAQVFANYLWTFQLSPSTHTWSTVDPNGTLLATFTGFYTGAYVPGNLKDAVAGGDIAIEPAPPGQPASSANLIIVNARSSTNSSLTSQAADGIDIYSEKNATLPLPRSPAMLTQKYGRFVGLDFHPDGVTVATNAAGASTAWVSDPTDDQVVNFPLPAGAANGRVAYEGQKVNVANFSKALAFDSGDGDVLTASFDDRGTVTELSATGTGLGSVLVGPEPDALGVDTTSNLVVVADSGPYLTTPALNPAEPEGEVSIFPAPAGTAVAQAAAIASTSVSPSVSSPSQADTSPTDSATTPLPSSPSTTPTSTSAVQATSTTVQVPASTEADTPTSVSVSVSPANVDGTVSLTSGGALLVGCASVQLSAGQGQCITTFTSPGTDAVVASYSGSPSTAASTSSAAAVVVTGLAVNPQPITFPATALGSSSSQQTLTITNPSSASVTVSSVLVQGDDATAFATSSDGCSGVALDPGASCSIVVTFTPDESGAAISTLEVTDSVSTEPQQIALSGSAM